MVTRVPPATGPYNGHTLSTDVTLGVTVVTLGVTVVTLGVTVVTFGVTVVTLGVTVVTFSVTVNLIVKYVQRRIKTTHRFLLFILLSHSIL